MSKSKSFFVIYFPDRDEWFTEFDKGYNTTKSFDNALRFRSLHLAEKAIYTTLYGCESFIVHKFCQVSEFEYELEASY